MDRVQDTETRGHKVRSTRRKKAERFTVVNRDLVIIGIKLN